MAGTTPNLGLPLLDSSQSEPEVPINEAFEILDAAVAAAGGASPGGGGGSIEITDGSVSVSAVSVLTVRNATVIDQGGGAALLDIDSRPGGGGRARDGGEQRGRRGPQGIPGPAGAASIQTAQAARIYRTTNQAIANATLVALSPDTADFDSGSPSNFWSAGSPTRLTAPQAGKYTVGCSILWDSSTTGNRSVYVCKNGTTGTRLAGEQMVANASGVLNLATTLNLASGDYIEFYVNQNSGGSVNVAGTEQISQMWIALVGTIYVPRIPCGCTWSRRGSTLQIPAMNGLFYVPRKSVIKGVSLLTQGSSVGSCLIDIWKIAVGSFPPTVANSIVASAAPQIVSGSHYTDTVLTGWTTALAAGDTLLFSLTSSSFFTQIALALWVEETSA